jgi:pimeloyl-ACP methyl ester carboxylesterase
MSLKVFFKINMLLFALLTTSSLVPVAATNSDTAKESRWAEQVIDGLLDGEAAWLIDDSGHEFLGILTEGDRSSGHAVVLLHGVGVHPNWPDVIYPLREGLLAHNMATLSLQMPILENGADPREYALLISEVPGRIDAALDYLDDLGYRHFTLIGHSLGATMAVYYLSQRDTGVVTSLVVIGMGPGIAATGTENLKALEQQVKVPVLDLYGSDDLEHVLNSVELRTAAGNKGSVPKYQQTKVTGANHFFQGYEEALVQQVVDWIEAQRN